MTETPKYMNRKRIGMKEMHIWVTQQCMTEIISYMNKGDIGAYMKSLWIYYVYE